MPNSIIVEGITSSTDTKSSGSLTPSDIESLKETILKEVIKDIDLSEYAKKKDLEGINTILENILGDEDNS